MSANKIPRTNTPAKEDKSIPMVRLCAENDFQSFPWTGHQERHYSGQTSGREGEWYIQTLIIHRGILLNIKLYYAGSSTCPRQEWQIPVGQEGNTRASIPLIHV
jgi:hypothetical protein